MIRASFLAVGCCLIAGAVFSAQPLWIEIENLTPTIREGGQPSLRVTLVNDTSGPVRIIAGKDSPNLQRWYFRPHLKSDSQSIDLVTPCDLPTPPTESDFQTLAPRESYTLTLSNFSSSFETLKRGRYDLIVRYDADGVSSESNATTLTVTK